MPTYFFLCFEHRLKHLAVGLGGRNGASGHDGLAAQRDDLVRQELRVALLVGHFGQEKLRKHGRYGPVAFAAYVMY
jgi:hypothetical protein